MCMLLAALVVAATTEQQQQQVEPKAPPFQVEERWVRAVEDILAHVVMGPLQPNLKASAFGQRNRTQILAVQTNHLRAHVMQVLLQSLEEEVQICPWPAHVGEAAAHTLVAELKVHEFRASWVPNLYRCPGHTGYISVHVPPPAF